MTAPRPCLSCGTVQRNGTRCPPCKTAADRPRNQRKQVSQWYHHTTDYRRRAAAVRAAANADPHTRCWRCNQPARHGDPWQAGHLIAGDPTGPLAPEHASCNSRAGRNNAPIDHSG